MLRRQPVPVPLADRGPLRVMYIHTEMVVGGAETLLAEIIRNMDRQRFQPELCCLKKLETLGEQLAKEVPTHTGLLRDKYDWRVLGRLTHLLKQRKIDAVVTVGTGGDRMFWGRLAAWRAGVPVILSALHSTGYPVVVEPINRLLAPITDGFIGCAKRHSEFLSTGEGCPAERVFTVWNGVDVDRFRPSETSPLHAELGIPADAPLAGIVAALRPEKQHVQLVHAMRRVVDRIPDARLIIVGDGVTRGDIEQKVQQLGLAENVHLLGLRHDVPQILAALDIKVLASKMEANPASTLEAGACGVAVVAPNVGSLPDTVQQNRTGLLVPPGDTPALAGAMIELLSDRPRAAQMGAAARELVESRFSLQAMVGGYEQLIEGIYEAASARRRLKPSEFDAMMEAEYERIAARRAARQSAEPEVAECLTSQS